MGEIHDSTDGEYQEIWLQLSNAKKLAKVLKKVTATPYCTVLHRLCRTAGYSNYDEALHSPRGLSISLDVWTERLKKEFDMPLEEILPGDEATVWYTQLFLQPGQITAMGMGVVAEYEPNWAQENLDDQSVPDVAHHERTIDPSAEAKQCLRGR